MGKLKKGSKLYKILEGISIKEVNAARGGKSEMYMQTIPNATKVEAPSFKNEDK